MIGRLAVRSLTAHPVRSAVLAAGFGRVLVQAADGLQVLDAASGQPLWRPDPGRTQTAPYYSIGPDAVLTGAPCGGN